jgi:GT2 family glycosyltransferase
MTVEPPAGAVGRVAAVILNWRRPVDTLACAASVAASDFENLDIIICDNDSGDGSIERILGGLRDLLPGLNEQRMARGWRPFVLRVGSGPDVLRTADAADSSTRRIWLIATGRNGGYAFGNNVGMRNAFLARDVAFAWILNNDTLVDPHALPALLRRMNEDSRIGICGAKVVYLERPDRVQSLGGGRLLPLRARCELLGMDAPVSEPVLADEVEHRLSYINGAAALVRRSLVETVGPMDEGYFLYWEEIDWAVRAASRFRLGFSPDAVVHHRVGATIGTNDAEEASPLSEFYLTRSRFRFLRLHRPWLLPIAYPLLLKAMALDVLAGRRSRARVRLAGAFGGKPPKGPPPRPHASREAAPVPR